MKGGEGKASIEGTSDFQGDQSQAEFNREEATFDRGAEARMYDYESGNETGDAAAAESFYAKQREEENGLKNQFPRYFSYFFAAGR